MSVSYATSKIIFVAVLLTPITFITSMNAMAQQTHTLSQADLQNAGGNIISNTYTATGNPTTDINSIGGMSGNAWEMTLDPNDFPVGSVLNIGNFELISGNATATNFAGELHFYAGSAINVMTSNITANQVSILGGAYGDPTTNAGGFLDARLAGLTATNGMIINGGGSNGIDISTGGNGVTGDIGALRIENGGLTMLGGNFISNSVNLNAYDQVLVSGGLLMENASSPTSIGGNIALKLLSPTATNRFLSVDGGLVMRTSDNNYGSISIDGAGSGISIKADSLEMDGMDGGTSGSIYIHDINQLYVTGDVNLNSDKSSIALNDTTNPDDFAYIGGSLNMNLYGDRTINYSFLTSDGSQYIGKDLKIITASNSNSGSVSFATGGSLNIGGDLIAETTASASGSGMITLQLNGTKSSQITGDVLLTTGSGLASDAAGMINFSSSSSLTVGGDMVLNAGNSMIFFSLSSTDKNVINGSFIATAIKSGAAVIINSTSSPTVINSGILNLSATGTATLGDISATFNILDFSNSLGANINFNNAIVNFDGLSLPRANQTL